MANEKTLHTRIQLKYDTLANWTEKNTLLLSGEIAIATIATTDPANKQHPPVMFKVGPGNFNNLEWASALAADVYSWAKKSGLNVETTTISDGEYVTGIKWENDTLKIQKASLVTDIANNGTSLKAATTKAIKDYVDTVAANIVAQGTVVAEGAKIDVAQEGNKYTVSHETVANPTETAGSGRKYLTGVTTDGYGHITGFTTASEVDQDLSSKKDVQTPVGDHNLSGATVVKGIAQDAQGVITVSTRDLTPADIGAQPAGSYKTTQEAVAEVGEASKTLKISQDTNGKISATPIAISITHDQVSDFDTAVAGIKVDNAETADKVAHSLTIGGKSFNGSDDVSVSLTDLDVYSKGEIDTLTNGKLHTEDNIKTIAATEINRLIGAADDEGGETIQSIANLVDYVEKNAGEIAGLVTDVNTANTNASNAVATANSANTTAGQALDKANEALEGAEGARASAAAAEASELEAKGYAASAKADASQAMADKAAAQFAQAKAEEAQRKAEAAQAEAEKA